MQKRVIIKVATKDYRDKEKAKAIAIGFPGVISAEFMTGYDYRNLMIVCEDMDFTALCYKLRKKVGYTEQVSMIPMKELPAPNAPEQQTTPTPTQTMPLQVVQMTAPTRGAPPIREPMTMPMIHNGPVDPLPTIGTPVNSILSSAPSPVDTPLHPMAQGHLSHASTPCHRVHPLNDNFSHANTRQHVVSVARDHHSTRASTNEHAPDHQSTHVSTHERVDSVAPDHHSTHAHSVDPDLQTIRASTHQHLESVAPGRHYTYANTPHQHGNQWSRHSDNYHSSGEEWGYCFIM